MNKQKMAWQAIVNLMDDGIREQVHEELAPCTEREFYDRYCELDPDFDAAIRASFGQEKMELAGL